MMVHVQSTNFNLVETRSFMYMREEKT